MLPILILPLEYLLFVFNVMQLCFLLGFLLSEHFLLDQCFLLVIFLWLPPTFLLERLLEQVQELVRRGFRLR